LKSNFQAVVKEGLSVKRMKKFLPSKIPILNDEKPPEDKILDSIESPPKSPPKTSPSKGGVFFAPLPESQASPRKSSMSPARDSAGATTERLTTQKTTEKDPDGTKTDRKVIVRINKDEKPVAGPMKISIYKRLQDEEKNKIREKRQVFQKRILEAKKKEAQTSPRNNTVEPMSPEKKYSILKTAMERMYSPEKPHRYHRAQTEPEHGPIAFSNSIYNISPLKIDRKISNESAENLSPTLPNPSNLYEKVVFNKLSNTLVRYPTQNDLDFRSQKSYYTGPTLYNSTFSKVTTESSIELPSIGALPSYQRNPHVVRMREIEDLKMDQYRKLNSKSQKMKYKEMLNWSQGYDQRLSIDSAEFSKKNDPTDLARKTEYMINSSSSQSLMKSIFKNSI
jgi:hypothetical protein